MNQGLQPVCQKLSTCKCCGAAASLYGVVDFHKNCEIYRRKVLDISGIPIYYYRCPLAGSSSPQRSTTSHARISRGSSTTMTTYWLILTTRSRGRVPTPPGCAAFFPLAKPARLLDYGGGNGVLAESLRAAGFPHAETYDPFVSGHSVRPEGRFDCIVSFEVLEHATDPRHVFADMNGLLSDPGIIVCSTLLQPADIDRQGLSWWYAGPRNGHVSLYSRTSLETVVRTFGFTLGSFNDCFHVLYKAVPDFARHFIKS